MNSVKNYLEQVLRKHNMPIEERHAVLLEAFAEDREVLDAYESLQQTQMKIAENWKTRVRLDDIIHRSMALENGMVGKPYSSTISIDLLNDIGKFELVLPPGAGLMYDRDTRTLSGTFAEPGELEIQMRFQLAGADENASFHTKTLRLVVNPDPKSLWLHKPSDANDPYWRMDDQSACMLFGSKKLVAGSKRGRSHAHEGRFRDDAFNCRFFDIKGWGVAAVADGAGSAKFSRKGADIACRSIIHFFDELELEKWEVIDNSVSAVMDEATEEARKKLSAALVETLGRAAFEAQARIREEAEARNAEIRDFATTLIFALVKRVRNQYVIASFWVGDGGIGIFSRDRQEVTLMGQPDGGEFAGQTRFLTMSEIFANGAYAHRIRFTIVEDFTALVLMTDGISDPKFQTDANLLKYDKWEVFWQDLEGYNDDQCKVDFEQAQAVTEAGLMTWLDFWSPGNHDDRTIVIIY